jgi:hypothetical protein
MYLDNCIKKVRYRSKTKAELAIKQIHKRRLSNPLNAYPCDNCCGWHVGKRLKIPFDKPDKML